MLWNGWSQASVDLILTTWVVSFALCVTLNVNVFLNHSGTKLPKLYRRNQTAIMPSQLQTVSLVMKVKAVAYYFSECIVFFSFYWNNHSLCFTPGWSNRQTHYFGGIRNPKRPILLGFLIRTSSCGSLTVTINNIICGGDYIITMIMAFLSPPANIISCLYYMTLSSEL